VTEGHPDKVCDTISDAILDACLKQDPKSRVACETLAKSNLVVIAGEITTKAEFDYNKVVREAIREIGYTEPGESFNAYGVHILNALTRQSPDIAQGVDTIKAEGKSTAEQGAGDQGLMFGYASNETKEYMPIAITYAHKLAMQLSKVRKDGTLKFLRPDGKTQVTFEFDDNEKPIRIEAIVVSSQHSASVSHDELCESIRKYVIDEVIPSEYIDENTKIFINPTGQFIIGGPHGDAGLTGRKIIVDTYGGYSRHGGGAFSGKDPSKVDRSAAYAARYVAKNIVAAGLADKCELQLAYAIGVSEPMSIRVDTFGTEKVSEEIIVSAILENFDLTPKGIIDALDLKRPIYKKTAAYGHFGRTDIDLPWEKLDKVESLKKYIK